MVQVANVLARTHGWRAKPAAWCVFAFAPIERRHRGGALSGAFVQMTLPSVHRVEDRCIIAVLSFHVFSPNSKHALLLGTILMDALMVWLVDWLIRCLLWGLQLLCVSPVASFFLAVCPHRCGHGEFSRHLPPRLLTSRFSRPVFPSHLLSLIILHAGLCVNCSALNIPRLQPPSHSWKSLSAFQAIF